MNFALSQEQEFLKEAAAGALSRVKTLEAAREALDGAALPDLWPVAVEAGWPGLLVSEERGGAGLGVIDAMLVFEELGRVLASVPLLGHVAATAVLDAAGWDGVEALASGERRAALVAARPPSDLVGDWTYAPELGAERVGAGSGTAHWVPDAPGADVLVVVGEGGALSVLESASVDTVSAYDATRSLGHVTIQGGTALDVGPEVAERAWFTQQALIGAECLGGVEWCLESGVAYAKERFTFGRAIGSYQAVKHALVEILRRRENARSLMYYVGWAAQDKPDELALAASAFRYVAGDALDTASRTAISVHGGIGATWEHDAPLYFRRAQLTRRLLGGNADAADRVAQETFASAA
jgi:alkylation response protein AidB-like acyl-CoA dehydrogenase